MNEAIIAKAVASGGIAMLLTGFLSDPEVIMLILSATLASLLSSFYDYAHSDDDIDIRLLADIIKSLAYAIVVIFVVFYGLSIYLHAKVEMPTVVWVAISALVASNAVDTVEWMTGVIKDKLPKLIDRLISLVGGKR